MGNGHSTKGKGICQGVVLKMQGLTMVEHYLPLQLRSTDVILNKQWLKSVRWIRIHWISNLTITNQNDCNAHTL
ncbi:unnamed protein product [Spirodela intermedia]|uniref:Uncharacterized protein n=1 Tax=Spirodela intermedia TaxID=51605 RepID=A0A7I8KE36_SPIIN|nr:unnamed protein product [Spirodela intermedia]